MYTDILRASFLTMSLIVGDETASGTIVAFLKFWCHLKHLHLLYHVGSSKRQEDIR